MSDTLSLVVFAVCVSIYTTGFSPTGVALLLAQIIGYIVLVLFGLSRVGAYVLKKVENEEDAYFVVMLSIMTIAGVLAAAIQLPDIVGAFLAGLAVNAAARDAPASAKLQFLGKSLFIPIFFMVTGFLVNPITFVSGTVENFLLVASIVGALLVGKEIAARTVGLACGYNLNERLTIWSLTLPQVAATLAATLVAHETFSADGERLLDDRMLNVVLVLVFTTSILGPLLTGISAGGRTNNPYQKSCLAVRCPLRRTNGSKRREGSATRKQRLAKRRSGLERSSLNFIDRQRAMRSRMTALCA